MPSLTRTEPLDPFEVESSARIFRRLLLRLAVLIGLASSLLIWRIVPILICVAFIVAFGTLTAAASRSHQRGRHAVRAGLFAARLSLRLIAAVAVVELAGFTGVLLVAMCLALSDEARAGIARGARRAAQHLRGTPVRRR
jgi:hypothetical protein